MRHLATLLCLFFAPLSVDAEQPQRKVIKPPVVKSVPRDFTRPQVRKPAGFGKQEWQRPQQQPQVKPSQNYRHGSIIIGRPYVNPYYYRMYRPPVIHHYYGPPVIIQPQPMPIYPMPFQGFFFNFRF